MKITLLLTGKTESESVRVIMNDFIKRIGRYSNFELVELPDIKNAKNLTSEQYKNKEAEIQEKYLVKSDLIVLLDEYGKELTSVDFARFLENKLQTGIKNMMFVVGGAFGFSDEIKKKAHVQLSLSKMTFPHQLVRMIFLEQLYRAFTIIRNEKYHHS